MLEDFKRHPENDALIRDFDKNVHRSGEKVGSMPQRAGVPPVTFDEVTLTVPGQPGRKVTTTRLLTETSFSVEGTDGIAYSLLLVEGVRRDARPMLVFHANNMLHAVWGTDEATALVLASNRLGAVLPLGPDGRVEWSDVRAIGLKTAKALVQGALASPKGPPTPLGGE